MICEHSPCCRVSAGTMLGELFPNNLWLLGSSTVLTKTETHHDTLEHLSCQLQGPGAAHTSICDASARGCQTKTHTK